MILFVNEFKNITENTVNEFTLWITHLTNLKCSICNKREFPTIANLESHKLHLGFVQRNRCSQLFVPFLQPEQVNTTLYCKQT